MSFEITRDHAYRRSHELRLRCPACRAWARINSDNRAAALAIAEKINEHGCDCPAAPSLPTENGEDHDAG